MGTRHARLRALAVATALAAALVTGGGVAVGAPSADAAACGVKIKKIYYNSPGSDLGSNASLNGEWIQLRNGCATGISLNGWKIKDLVGHTYTFGSYTLAGGGLVKIHTGKGTNKATDRYWGQTWYIWNNDKDTAKLFKGTTVVHSCSYNSTAVEVKTCS
jgi:hypothetical protein